MLADVTNRSRSPRGFLLSDGTTALLDPGAAARLDLADHPLHRAWEAAGDVAIVPLHGAGEIGAGARKPERRPKAE